MLASAHALHLPTAPCPSILGLRPRFRVECQRTFNKGGGHCARQCQGVSGFRVWLLAEHPKRIKGSCIGFNNILSRLCTLVDLQDV